MCLCCKSNWCWWQILATKMCCQHWIITTFIKSQVNNARYINVGDGCKKREYQRQVKNVGDQFGFLVTDIILSPTQCYNNVGIHVTSKLILERSFFKNLFEKFKSRKTRWDKIRMTNIFCLFILFIYFISILKTSVIMLSTF